MFFIAIIGIFYILDLALPGVDLQLLRSKGWVFDAPPSAVPWYHFYTLYNFHAVDTAALASTIPAMLALTFFGILHVPINIPALGMSTQQDVDLDGELRAHGLSNALSGLCGSIQNYLVYTNTVLFMRSGGNRRLAGVLLALATAGIMFCGPVVIGYVPVMVVGSLIFYLGFDLLREALVDSIGKTHIMEYLTILIIVLTMGLYDFVVGVVLGIVLACVGYVIRTSRISAIRSTITGGLASSTVRRHALQSIFLQEVGEQIFVMRLAGYLFFGTIVGVENRVRALFEEDVLSSRPIRFLVIDLTNVDGIDFSSAEAITRINRVVKSKDIYMVMCGFLLSSDVGKSLRNVGLLNGDDGIEFFEGLNPALEYCENQLLRAFYQKRESLEREQKVRQMPASAREVKQQVLTDPSIHGSPRTGHLHAAAANTFAKNQAITPRPSWQTYGQPLQLILQTFAGVSTQDEAFWRPSARYFQRREYQAGATLYQAGDPSDELYLLESGILKAKYQLPESPAALSEVVMPGCPMSELPFMSETLRTSTTSADRPSTVWVLDRESWRRLQAQEPAIAKELLMVTLSLTSERMNTITRYMLLQGT